MLPASAICFKNSLLFVKESLGDNVPRYVLNVSNLVAASFATHEVINFMVKYGRGLVCLPLTGAKCDELALHPQGSPIGIRVRSM
jgi:hypothetical protein